MAHPEHITDWSGGFQLGLFRWYQAPNEMLQTFQSFEQYNPFGYRSGRYIRRCIQQFFHVHSCFLNNHHPQLDTLQDAYLHDGQYWLSYPLYKGTGLHQVKHRSSSQAQPLPAHVIGLIGLQYCEAMLALEALIEHRELPIRSTLPFPHPACLILTETGQLKLRYVAEQLILLGTLDKASHPSASGYRLYLERVGPADTYALERTNFYTQEKEIDLRERHNASSLGLLLLFLGNPLPPNPPTEWNSVEWTRESREASLAQLMNEFPAPLHALMRLGVGPNPDRNSPSLEQLKSQLEEWLLSLQVEPSAESLRRWMESQHYPVTSGPPPPPPKDELREADAMERTALLRELLAQEPSLNAQLSLYKLFHFWPKEEDRNFALDYALEHIYLEERQSPPLRYHHRQRQGPQRPDHFRCVHVHIESANLLGKGRMLRKEKQENNESTAENDFEVVPAIPLEDILEEKHFARFSRVHLAVALGLSFLSSLHQQPASRDFAPDGRLERPLESALFLSYDGLLYLRMTPLDGGPTPLLSTAFVTPEYIRATGKMMMRCLIGSAGEAQAKRPQQPELSDALYDLIQRMLTEQHSHETLGALVEALEVEAEKLAMTSTQRFLAGWLYYTMPAQIVLDHYLFLLQREGTFHYP